MLTVVLRPIQLQEILWKLLCWNYYQFEELHRNFFECSNVKIELDKKLELIWVKRFYCFPKRRQLEDSRSYNDT